MGLVISFSFGPNYMSVFPGVLIQVLLNSPQVVLFCTDLYFALPQVYFMCRQLAQQIFFKNSSINVMGCWRQFRAFGANHCNLSWNEGKGPSARRSCLIPVPRASQRDLGSRSSAPRASYSTARRHERCPPLSRTSDEPAAPRLETKVKRRVRAPILKGLSFNHTSQATASPGYFWVSLLTGNYIRGQSLFLLDSSEYTRTLSPELKFSSQQLPSIDSGRLPEILLSRVYLLDIWRVSSHLLFSGLAAL